MSVFVCVLSLGRAPLRIICMYPKAIVIDPFLKLVRTTTEAPKCVYCTMYMEEHYIEAETKPSVMMYARLIFMLRKSVHTTVTSLSFICLEPLCSYCAIKKWKKAESCKCLLCFLLGLSCCASFLLVAHYFLLSLPYNSKDKSTVIPVHMLMVSTAIIKSHCYF